MALMQRMELRQGQSLVMTPQLQQAIKLLQMSNLELQAYVEASLTAILAERDERTDVQKNEGARRCDTVSLSPESEDKPQTDTDLENGHTHEAAPMRAAVKT
jgi:RNA polymerase sigma-54 factor